MKKIFTWIHGPRLEGRKVSKVFGWKTAMVDGRRIEFIYKINFLGYDFEL